MMDDNEAEGSCANKTSQSFAQFLDLSQFSDSKSIS